MASLDQVAGRALATALCWPRLSRLTARFADLRLPAPVLERIILAYAHVYGVDLSEAAEPPAAYPSFNAFFTRKLRAGVRSVDTRPAIVVSPCDARVSALGPIPEDGRLDQVKGRTYSMEALLGSPEDAAPLRGGLAATLYLSPAMYHRVHAPVDATVRAWRYLPGRLYPVNPGSARSVPGLFTVNERVVLFLDAPDLGPLAMVLVGAANVGRITLTFTDLVTNRGIGPARVAPAVPPKVRRGDELGAFNLGSTVVLLAALPGLAPVGVAIGDVVRMGQALWQRA